MNKILDVLKDNPALKQMLSGKGEIVTNNINDEAYLIAGAFIKKPKQIIIIKQNQYQALHLYYALKGLLKDVCYYPSDESLRVEAVAYSYELLGERMNSLYLLSLNQPVICIAHTHSVIRYITPLNLFKESIIHLKVHQIIEPLELRQQLLRLGYQITQRVDSPFYMSRRGGVIDVYSIQYEHPVRIEFFDNEIETISFFYSDTQRRSEKIDEVTLLPATEMLYDHKNVDSVIKKIKELKEAMHLEKEYQDELDENIALDIEALKSHDYSLRLYQYLSLFEHKANLLDYAKGAMIITSGIETIHNAFKRFTEESFFYFHEIQEIGEMVKGLDLYYDIHEITSCRDINFTEFKLKDNQIEFLTQPVTISMINNHTFLTQLKDYAVFNKVLICLNEKRHIDSLIRLFEEHQIKYTLVTNDSHIYKNTINIYFGNLPSGIQFVHERLVLLTSHELFTAPIKRKGYIKYKNASVIKDYNELNIGDYVVHDTNGIGQYMGIKTLEVQGIHKDFLYIAYKGNDVLYVPVENFRLIRKYSSRDGKVPHVHELSGTKWAKEKARVRAKVDGLADDLIALYAQRMAQPGFAFKEDNEIQMTFEQQFGYELTLDQQRAIDEIKTDMEKPRPMDRLLCGDVGFGKTEVAIRACMKAILSNKQCAFLCPTTILSSQHYRVMKKRFADFPVTIALLNRFTSSKTKKEILNDLKNGKIDLLIGTHRILSKDVVFKDLGLLCIDEEQRFGVRQKEKIKEYRKTIDVLTLTATPIPRTLQMSLMGIRGLSQIETPPLNRLPVQTYVSEYSPPLVKQVIERELARDGQIFYLHNRTDNIYETASQIQSLVPNARIGVGHGQMKKEELEDVMQEFVDHQYDILVCTTIIETGIDIPNANTILVEDADHFGLAQLYQIKGRVGRSERLAYAYLLYRKNKIMNEEAVKRLKAIKEFTQLGSGYKIAMRDLSIRGSGDILGGEQAGFIDSVGFDMYMKILQEAILEKQGQSIEEEDIPVSNVKVNGYIPNDYLESDMEKLELYQRIYKANKMTQLNLVEKELRDLYGELPREIENIIIKRRFEILSHNKKIRAIDDNAEGMTIHFTHEFSKKTNGEYLFRCAHQYFHKPKFAYASSEISIEIAFSPEYIHQIVLFLQDVLKI